MFKTFFLAMFGSCDMWHVDFHQMFLEEEECDFHTNMVCFVFYITTKNRFHVAILKGSNCSLTL